MKSLQRKLAGIFAIGLTISVLPFAGCKKPHDPDPVEPPTCRITNFTYKINLDPRILTGTVSYNNAENPTSVLIDMVRTGDPHALFRYDKFNRLTDHIGSYSGTTDPANLPGQFLFEYWVTYVYADDNPASLPVRDTLRGLGQYTNGAFTYISNSTVETFTYDAEKRIVKIDATAGVPSRTFSYDANGNLILPNVTYDNRKNYRQTNKVWKLIDRNFSKNNPFTATQYNSEGYPTIFPAPANSLPLDYFLRRGMNFQTMNYSCSANSAAP